MSVNICCGREIAMTKPVLYLFHGNAVGKQERGTTMAKLVEVDNDGAYEIIRHTSMSITY